MVGRINEEDIALVRERARIDEVVGEYVTLRHAGGDSLKGLCPFHDEKSPSFHVRPNHGLYHCFGCGAHGDVFEFVKEHENVDFRAALCSLAERYGVVDTAPRAPRSNAERANAWREERLRQALAAATGPVGRAAAPGSAERVGAAAGSTA